jgi:hypothetical protein
MFKTFSRPAPVLVAVILAAGCFDLVFASTFWWIKADVGPMRIGQSIAAGILGSATSRAGGWPTALLGVALHFLIMSAMVATYYFVAKKIAVLQEKWTPFGALYGVMLFVVMSYVVVPLSAVGGAGPKEMSWWVGLSVLVHMLIGVACAWAARKALRENRSC